VKLILFLCVMLLSAAGVHAGDYDEYVFDEPIRLNGEVFEDAGDFEEHGGFTLELMHHTSGDREVEEIIVSGSSYSVDGEVFLSPLLTQLTDDGSLGYELIRTPGERGTKTVSGLSKSYKILCDIEASLHFLFYKGRHVYSASSVQVEEIHKKYEVFSVGGGKTDSESSKEPYAKTIYSDGFDSRIERAAEIGYNTKQPEHSYIEEYEVCDGSGSFVCTMEVAHPEVREMNVLQKIALVGGTAGVTLMSISEYRRRKKHK